MSPKRNVLKRYPDAYAASWRINLRSAEWSIWTKPVCGSMLALKRTARAAWAAAERAVKGAR